MSTANSKDRHAPLARARSSDVARVTAKGARSTTIRVPVQNPANKQTKRKRGKIAKKDSPYRQRLQEAASLISAKKYDTAKPILQKVLTAEPNNPDGIHLTGLTHLLQNRDQMAIDWISRAIAIRPNVSSFHHNISGAYSRLGQFDKVCHHEEEAIRLKPDYAEAYHGLASARKFKAPEPLVDAIETQLKNDSLPDRDQAYFHFAAGKILDDLGEYDRAFPHYRSGNRLMHRRFNIKALETLARDSIYQYGPSYVSGRTELGYTGTSPLFIVSMPRSGSTLLEQILTGHSALAAAGEVPDIFRISQTIPKALKSDKTCPHFMPDTSAAMLSGFGRAYVDRVRTAAGVKGTELRTIDKNPLNFRYVGLISEILPKAKILNIRRDPRDTCLSCYFQNFTEGQGYAYSLKNLGRVYNIYRRLCDHWRSVFPDMFLDVDYEELVADTEGVTRRILDFCDLEFEKSCLEFHENKRRVATASAWQVRKPVYKGSLQRWKRYERHLGPLLDVLELD